MNVSVFGEKLNKLQGNTYVIEEEVQLTNGIYEAELAHDNINTETFAIWTGRRLTGDQIQTYSLSTPSLTPWKKILRVYADVPAVFISYETDGDTVEAEDISRVESGIVDTQKALNQEIKRAEDAEQGLAVDLAAELDRAQAAEAVNAKAVAAEIERAVGKEAELSGSIADESARAKLAEKENADRLAAEEVRATESEAGLQGSIDVHTATVEGEIQALKSADISLGQEKANVSYVNSELDKRYTKEQVYTKDEVMRQIEELIGSAPETLDTLKEIADALGNDPNFTGTIMNALAGKVDKVIGKQLSTNDYSAGEKTIVADVNEKKHTHNNKSILDKLTQAMLDNLSNAFIHISDTVKHITAGERSSWNSAFAHISLINNPHAITKEQVGLGNVENKTSAAIRRELTPQDIVAALGYTPEQGYSHPESGVSAGTYKSVTVNKQGHVIAGTNPTTLAGYGITDAIQKGAYTWMQLQGAFSWDQLKGV